MLHAWRTVVCAALVAWGVCVTAALASPVMLSTQNGARDDGAPSWSTAAQHVHPDAIARAVADDVSSSAGEEQSAPIESTASAAPTIAADPAGASSPAPNAPALIPLPAAASTGALVLGGLAFVQVCRTLRAARRS